MRTDMNTLKERSKEAWSNYEYREGFLYNTTFEDGYVIGATEQKKIDMTLFLELCERWKKIYLRKCQSPSEYSRTIAPGQCDAIDLLLHDVFKEMGIDEETFIKAHREE